MRRFVIEFCLYAALLLGIAFVGIALAAKVAELSGRSVDLVSWMGLGLGASVIGAAVAAGLSARRT